MSCIGGAFYRWCWCIYFRWWDWAAQPDGSMLWLENAAWIWVPFLLLFTVMAWFGMNDLAANKASLKAQLPVLKRGHLWVLSLLYLATFGSFIGFLLVSQCYRKPSFQTSLS